MYVLRTSLILAILGFAHGVENKCTKPGLMCSDCSHQTLCISTGPSFLSIKMACEMGSSCMNNSCVAGAKCNSRAFVCTDVGSFPDPYDCKVHHICSVESAGEIVGNRVECPLGSYSAATATCGYPMDTDACVNGPMPKCSRPLQIGTLSLDNSIYYICTEDEKEMGPELYKCPGGKIFDESKVSCVANEPKKPKKVK